ncbi:MAG: hypothetical protein AAGA48_26985 [Myxococcota bacterium]
MDSERTLRQATVVACALLMLAHALWRSTWFIDDAAIGFAYARNVAEGFGLVAWPGAEPVEAYSHPSWIAVLALAHGAGLDGFAFAKPFSALCAVAQLPLVVDLARRALPDHRGPGPLIAAVLLAASGPFAIGTASGLENAWFAWWLTLAAHRLVVEGTDGGHPWSALAFLLVTWTRPEGFLYAMVGGAMGTWRAARERRWDWITLFWGAWLGPSLVLEGARFAYFGSPLPNSYYAKRVALDAWLNPDGRGWTQLCAYASRSWHGFLLPLYALGVMGWRRVRGVSVGSGLVFLVMAWPGPHRLARAAWWPSLPEPPEFWPTLQLLVVGLAIAMLPFFASRHPASVARGSMAGLVATGLGFWLAANGDWMGGFRFASYAAPLASVVLAVGIVDLADAWQAQRGGSRWGVEATWLAAGLTGLAVIPGLNLARDHATANFDVTTAMMERRVAHIRDVQRRLGWRGSLTVADMDIGGYLWFAPDLRVLDLVGLVEPEVARRKREGPSFLHPYVFERRRPDLIHLHGPDWWWSKRTQLMDHPAWSKTYVQLRDYQDVPGVPHDPHPGLWIRRDRVFGEDPDPDVAWSLAPGWTLEATPRLTERAAVLSLRRTAEAGPIRLVVWVDGREVGTWASDAALVDPASWPDAGVLQTHVDVSTALEAPKRWGVAVGSGPPLYFDTKQAPHFHTTLPTAHSWAE